MRPKSLFLSAITLSIFVSGQNQPVHRTGQPQAGGTIAQLSPAVRAEIERIADGTDAGKRATAITSLVQLGPIPPVAIPYLVGCLSDNREILTFGGPVQGKTSVGVLAGRVLLRSGSQSVKAALAALPNHSVVVALYEMTGDEATAVRSTVGSDLDKLIDQLGAINNRIATLAIGQLGGPHAVAVLGMKLDGSRSQRDINSAAAGLANVVEATMDAKAVDLLLGYLSSGEPGRVCEEHQFMSALARIGSARSVDLLAAGLRPWTYNDKSSGV